MKNSPSFSSSSSSSIQEIKFEDEDEQDHEENAAIKVAVEREGASTIYFPDSPRVFNSRSVTIQTKPCCAACSRTCA
jgi:hypothetical protein